MSSLNLRFSGFIGTCKAFLYWDILNGEHVPPGIFLFIDRELDSENFKSRYAYCTHSNYSIALMIEPYFSDGIFFCSI